MKKTQWRPIEQFLYFESFIIEGCFACIMSIDQCTISSMSLPMMYSWSSMDNFLLRCSKTKDTPGKRTAGLVRMLPHRALQKACCSTAAATFSSRVLVLQTTGEIRFKIRDAPYIKKHISCQLILEIVFVYLYQSIQDIFWPVLDISLHMLICPINTLKFRSFNIYYYFFKNI